MELIKWLHVGCALTSGLGFFIRGLWMLQGSSHLDARWVKIAPHLLDTLLLGSAITLAWQMHLVPTQQPWLAAKIAALLLYIALGTIALKRGKTRGVRCTAWLLGLGCYLFIISAAVSKSPLGPLLWL